MKFIMGLYENVRKGVKSNHPRILSEINYFLKYNKKFLSKNEVLFLAGDVTSFKQLKTTGLKKISLVEDVPPLILKNKRHFMKHYMVYLSLKKFEEVIWIDWDVFILKEFDPYFFHYAKNKGTPKFIKIPNYWATVNCGFYYVNSDWLLKMEESFAYMTKVSEPNDELLWKSVLPENVMNLKEFFWNDLALNIWEKDELNLITKNTYVLHLRNFSYVKYLYKQIAS